MTSLSDVYEGGVGIVADRRQRVAGAALFAVGAAMAVGAIPIATTDLATGAGLTVFEAREFAGILAGLGVPAVLVGILTVVPAGRGTRATAAIGASLCVLGVALFVHAYPYDWVAGNPGMAVATTVLYTLGSLLTFWALFLGVATFKTRNDPGGTTRLEITDEGTLRVVSGDNPLPGMGGIGLFGTDPQGEVDTQTNRIDDEDEEETLVPEPTVDETAAGVGSQQSGTPKPAGDGAGAVHPPADDDAGPTPGAADADIREAVEQRGRPDQYCGNCEHFEYVRADGEITPFCGFHDELMEDMDACDQWDPNS